MKSPYNISKRRADNPIWSPKVTRFWPASSKKTSVTLSLSGTRYSMLATISVSPPKLTMR